MRDEQSAQATRSLGAPTPREGVAVAIVNYTTAPMVIASLPALLAEFERLPGSGHHAYIVDNASPGTDADDLAGAIAANGWEGQVTLIRSAVNGGFAAGNNLAFRAIRRHGAETGIAPEAVLLHNPDAAVRPRALTAMLELMRALPRAGFVGPRLANPDGSTWPGAFRFPSAGSELATALGIGTLLRRYPTVLEALEEPAQVDWVTGTATLIRGETFEALGDMDEGYFLYFEEIDYQQRGNRLGWEAWHLPSAIFEHEAGSATGITHGQAREGRTPAYRFEAWARYFARNHGPLGARGIALLRLIGMIAGTAQRRLRGKPSDFAPGFIQDFARHVLFARLSPPPSARTAWAQSEPGGEPGTAARAPAREGTAMSDDGASDAYREAEAAMAIPPVAERGRSNDNPKGISFWALVAEDFRTHERRILEQGFWAVFTSRFGNWRMDQPKVIRAPATLLYLAMFKFVEVFGGISLWYTVQLGRRVRIWHHGGIILGCRAIGDDVQIRQNTTIGVGQTGRNAALPIVGARADIGAGACVGGAVLVGEDAKIGANALVITDVPSGATVMGNPAQIVSLAPSVAPQVAAPTPAQDEPAIAARPSEAKAPAAPPPTPMLTTPRSMGRIALLGSQNLDYLAMSLAEEGGHLGLEIETEVPPFGTAQMALLDEASPLRAAMAGEPSTRAALIAERGEDVLGPLLANPLSVAPEDREAAVEAALAPFLSLIESARSALPGPVLVLSLAQFSRSRLGLADDAVGPDGAPLGAADLLARANAQITAAIAEHPDTHLIDAGAIIAEVGLDAAAPGGFWHMGRVPFGEAFANRLSRRVFGALLALRGQTTRLLVLDLDDTLWGGIIGEDGIGGVALGGSYPGTAYQEFQTAIRALSARGIALAIASKNDEDIALRMITEHPEMVLTLEDFVAHRIDWNEKSMNVASMLDELGLGEASCMFIDDNPVERAKMRRNLSNAVVPHFPSAPEELTPWLLDNPFLETVALTKSDLKRTAQYRVRGRVNAERRNFENVEAFYRDLGMVLRFEPFGEMNRQRVLQLFAKTNQFNTTTRRHDASAVDAIIAEGGEVYAVGYRDRHVEDELMGVLVLRHDDAMASAHPEDAGVQAGRQPGAVWVDSFVLSCRVLGRTVEHAIAAWASARSKTLGTEAIIGQIIETPRNTPCRNVFAASGYVTLDPNASTEGQTLYRRNLASEGAAPIPNYFQVEGPEAAIVWSDGVPTAASSPSTKPTIEAQAPIQPPMQPEPQEAPAKAGPAGGPGGAEPELAALFCKLFRLDKDIDLSTASMDTIERWDSLGHLKLGMEIERRLGIRLTAATLGGIRSFSQLTDAIAAERARAA
ncbi:MAG: HAD-IIIC family phosphatase [Pseudomonadota bacterium]